LLGIFDDDDVDDDDATVLLLSLLACFKHPVVLSKPSIVLDLTQSDNVSPTSRFRDLPVIIMIVEIMVVTIVVIKC